MGALTSKQYAFKVRPWELTTTTIVNAFDPFGSFFKIQVANNAILRVLPMQSNWIADNMRFFVDGISKSRVLSNYMFTSNKQYLLRVQDFVKVRGYFSYISRFLQSNIN